MVEKTTFNFNTTNPMLLNIQNYIRDLLLKAKIKCFYGRDELEISEVISPSGGLPLIIQQALLTDCFSGANHVWDAGFNLKKEDRVFSGYVVEMKPPREDTGHYLLLHLVHCGFKQIAKCGEDGQPKMNLDDFPVFALADNGNDAVMPVDWDMMEDYISSQENTYLNQIGEEKINENRFSPY